MELRIEEDLSDSIDRSSSKEFPGNANQLQHRSVISRNTSTSVDNTY